MLLLENVRFYKEEEKNDVVFAKDVRGSNPNPNPNPNPKPDPSPTTCMPGVSCAAQHAAGPVIRPLLHWICLHEHLHAGWCETPP